MVCLLLKWIDSDHRSFIVAMFVCVNMLIIILPSQQMRRSNRQVKRKKYTEDLDIKITDDEDEPVEEVDVITPAAILPAGPSQSMGTTFQEPEGDGLPSLQFFVVKFTAFFGHSTVQKLFALLSDINANMHTQF